MPMFRVTGDYTFTFVHTVEAASADEADRLVSKMSPNDFDSTDSGTIDVQWINELDEDGDEID